MEASNINPADCYQGISLTWVHSVCNKVYLRKKQMREQKIKSWLGGSGFNVYLFTLEKKVKNEIRTVTDISNKVFCIVLRRKIMTDLSQHSFNCVTSPLESRQGNT